jgi:hypothetical protein
MTKLQKATTLHPRHPKAVLAIGSVMQDNLDIDGALMQYRVAASILPDSPQVCSPNKGYQKCRVTLAKYSMPACRSRLEMGTRTTLK